MWQQTYVPLCTSLAEREQQLYQEYLTRLRLKDRKFFHTPAGTVGPLERGLIKATGTNSGAPELRLGGMGSLIELRFIKFNWDG